VIGIDAASATVTVGPREALERTTLSASRVNWLAGDAPAAGTRVNAQIRYRHREAPATLHPDGDRVNVAFDAPQSAVAPGQAVVFYDGDVVIGGGWID
jgi:tRNA-specific 2-thiouridylase